MVQCIGCKLVYQAPRPAPHTGRQLYPPSYEPFQATVADAGYIPRDLRRTAAFVNALRPEGGRLLDVGCGAGDFLVTMSRLYPPWQLAGIEASPQAADYARERGLSVAHTTLEDARETNAPVNVVTLWNVLEHLADPVAMLRRIEQWLAPGGFLCLAVPVHDSWAARVFGKYWAGWELPRHFYMFDQATIISTLDAGGFTVVRKACISGTYYGIVRSSLLALEGIAAPYALRRMFTQSITSKLGRAVLKPPIWLSESFQRGTVLTLAAQPKRDIVR